MAFGKSGRMGFDFPHGLTVINMLLTIGAFVKFQGWNDVGSPLIFPLPVSADFFDIFATACWTDRYVQFFIHNYIAFLEDIRK